MSDIAHITCVFNGRVVKLHLMRAQGFGVRFVALRWLATLPPAKWSRASS
jgi:hypothetical protein